MSQRNKECTCGMPADGLRCDACRQWSCGDHSTQAGRFCVRCEAAYFRYRDSLPSYTAWKHVGFFLPWGIFAILAPLVFAKYGWMAEAGSMRGYSTGVPLLDMAVFTSIFSILSLRIFSWWGNRVLRRTFTGEIMRGDPERLVIEAVLGAMEASGDISDEEMVVLHRNLDEHELFESLGPEQTARLIDLAATSIRKADGGLDRVQAIATRLPVRHHRAAAYTMAYEICLSDGEVSEGELEYLRSLQRALQIHDDVAYDLREAARSNSGLPTLKQEAARLRELIPHLVDCLALVATRDGEVRAEELRGLRAVLEQTPEMAVLSADELEEAIERAFQRIGEKNVTDEFKVVAESIDRVEDRYWITVYMMVVARASGKVAWRTSGFLGDVKTAFGLAESQMDDAMSAAAQFSIPDRRSI